MLNNFKKIIILQDNSLLFYVIVWFFFFNEIILTFFCMSIPEHMLKYGLVDFAELGLGRDQQRAV